MSIGSATNPYDEMRLILAQLTETQQRILSELAKINVKLDALAKMSWRKSTSII